MPQQKKSKKQSAHHDHEHAKKGGDTCCSHGDGHAHGHSHEHGADHHHGHSHGGPSVRVAASAPSPAPSARPSFRSVSSAAFGRALVASRDIPEGELIVRESPLVLLHFASNRPRVRVCAHCARFIGRLQHQMVSLMSPTPGGPDRGPKPFLPATLPVISAEDALLHAQVACSNKCGDFYCSDAHREEAWRRGHARLCTAVAAASGAVVPAASAAAATGKKASKKQKQEAAAAAATSNPESVSSEHPYTTFCSHAQRHHEFFAAAAKVAAAIVMDTQNGIAEKDALSDAIVIEHIPCGSRSRARGSPFARALHHLSSLSLSAPYAAFVQKAWWHIVNPRSADDESSSAAVESKKRRRDASSDEDDDPASVEAHLRAVVGHSFHLLSQALFAHHGESTPQWFTLEWYASLIGAFRWNALAVEHANPLGDYFDVVQQTVRQIEEENEQTKKEKKEEDESEDDDDDDDDDDGDDDDGDDDADDSSDDEEEEDADLGNPASDIQNLLVPVVERMMEVRLDDRRARAALRAHLARADADPSDAFARVRPLERDSYPPMRYDLSINYDRSLSKSVRFTSRLFPSFHGSALYPTIAQVNHSCEPNAAVDHRQDAEGQLHATRLIRKGEQIFISYIDEEQSTRARQDELREYGFTCRCQRCRQEQE